MNLERIAWVDKRNDPETCAAIERNGFGDPVPVEAKEFGYWVTKESLEQYRAGQMATWAKDSDAIVTSEPDTDDEASK